MHYIVLKFTLHKQSYKLATLKANVLCLFTWVRDFNVGVTDFCAWCKGALKNWAVECWMNLATLSLLYTSCFYIYTSNCNKPITSSSVRLSLNIYSTWMLSVFYVINLLINVAIIIVLLQKQNFKPARIATKEN